MSVWAVREARHPTIVQAVALPAIFGALSQTLAYRRTAKASVMRKRISGAN